MALFVKVNLLTLALILLVPPGFTTGAAGTMFAEKDSIFNHWYLDAVNSSSVIVYNYRLSRKEENRDATLLRLKIQTSNGTTPTNPIYVKVIQENVMSSSLQVPFTFSTRQEGYTSSGGESDLSYHAERTLCILGETDTEDNSVPISIVISTRSEVSISYNLTVEKSDDFLLSLNTPRTIYISPSSPVYYGFLFDSAMDLARVKIFATAQNHDDSHCTTLSIQPFSCPIFDLWQTTSFKGKWKTITGFGMMNVEQTSTEQNGFVVVLMAHGSEDLCSRKNPFEVPNPDSQFSIDNGIKVFPQRSAVHDPHEKAYILNVTSDTDTDKPDDSIMVSIWWPVLLTFTISLISVSLLICCRNCLLGKPSRDLYCQYSSLGLKSSNGKQSQRKWRSSIVLSEFRAVCKQENRYAWLTVASACFYIVPVLQFAIFYYRISVGTGNYDSCYYNDRCSNQVGPIVDFNHVWSNITYVIFGLVFILVVYIRRRCITANMEGLKLEAGDHGIRHSFGLMYGLGISLISEGVLSAIYHLCPNQATFQFDTCFMYVIAILILLKIYNNRHPGFVKAERIYMVLASMSTIPVIEFLFEVWITPGSSTIWFTILLIIQILVLILLAVHYCLIGYVMDDVVDDDDATPKPITDIRLLHPLHVCNLDNWKRVALGRYVLPGILAVTSAAVFACHLVAQLSVSAFALYLLIVNTMATIIGYMVLKVLHGEYKSKCTLVLPLIYMTMGMGLGAWAASYYGSPASLWNLSPSESRKLNDDCKIFISPELSRFYDAHDFWHFLSSGSLFFLFMWILVLDNDLTYAPQDQITVF